MNYADDVLGRILVECPDLDERLAELYALLALVKGRATTLEDVHDAWSVWRNRSWPNHRSLRPFDELPPEMREQDRPYMEAIHRAASALERQGWTPPVEASAEYGHVYLSTACRHSHHDYCAAMTGYQGEKRPARCKFCQAGCVCPCHEEAGDGG